MLVLSTPDWSILQPRHSRNSSSFHFVEGSVCGVEMTACSAESPSSVKYVIGKPWLSTR